VLGEALTHDGHYVLAADGSGAAVVSVPAAELGSPDALLGYLEVPASGHRAGGAIEVVTSPDDRFAFVSLEGSAEIAPGHGVRGAGTLRVIDLRTAERDPGGSVVARVSAGCGPSGSPSLQTATRSGSPHGRAMRCSGSRPTS
jgi:hypothetical protein